MSTLSTDPSDSSIPPSQIGLSREGKRPRNVLGGAYGHPTHPILVTIPIGAWVSSLVFDIGSHIVDDGRFLSQGSTWLIAIGILGAVLAALTGALDLMTIPRNTATLKIGLTHMALNLAIVVAYVLNWLWRNGDDMLEAVPAGRIWLSAISLVVLSVSGYLGGTLAYRHGVRVATEEDQAKGRMHRAR
jgi:uncharacterized membrane protein